MDKENYNIDDILSEVKKRREENEKEIKARDSLQEESVDEILEEIAEETAEEENTSDDPQEADAPENPAEEQLLDAEPELHIVTEDFSEQEESQDVPEEPEEEGDADAPQKAPEKAELPAENEEDMVDILELSEKSDEELVPEFPEEEPPKKKNHKVLKGIIITLVVLIVAAVAAAGIIINGKLDTLINGNDISYTGDSTTTAWKGMDVLSENFEPIEETEATELASFQDMLKTWYYNGTPCSSTHVLNVLLIGEDTRGSKILEDGTRADSAILVSVNIDTKQITMTSILRDTWAYYETQPGKESTGRFEKINGAMANGDVYAYMNAIEKLYKVEVNNYVIVNFDSFEKIIDTLGGVTLEMTDREINEINNHQKRYNYVTIEKQFTGTKGEQKLTGKQALAYCRIRKIDSDGKRADRQKNCLIEVFNETKDASTTKLLKIINTLIPYVKTNFGKSDIVKIATYAISQGWLKFNFYTQNLPEMNVWGGNGGSGFSGQWIWKADFPADAYNLQTRVYGRSNITLARVRVDIKNAPATGFYKEGARAMYTTYTNYRYGEASTLPEPTTEKEDE